MAREETKLDDGSKCIVLDNPLSKRSVTVARYVDDEPVWGQVFDPGPLDGSWPGSFVERVVEQMKREPWLFDRGTLWDPKTGKATVT